MRIPILPIIFTLLVVGLAVTQLNVTALISAVQRARIEWIGIAFIPWIILIILKAIKWKSLVASLEGKISIRESAKVLFIGLFVSVATPGRLGDFVRAWYIRDRFPLGKGILVVLVDRAMDVITLLIFAGVGLIILAQTSGVEIISETLIIGLVGACVVALALGLNKRVAKKISKYVFPLLPQTIRHVLMKHGHGFYDAIPLFLKNRENLILALLTSTGAWVMSVTFGWYIMIALNISADWVAALSIIPILALVEIIPVGVLGIGTRELAAVIVMGAYGISPESAVTFSLTYFALGYIPSFLMGAWLFNRQPVSFKGNKDFFSD